MLLISMILSLAPSFGNQPVKKQYGPVVTRLAAEVQITNSKSLDDIALLDGAVLELGPVKCTVQAGKCSFESLPPKTHVASVLYDPKASGVDFRFTGTQEGLLFNARGKTKVIYRFEKIIDPSVQIAIQEEVRYRNTDVIIDSSLTAELWIKIVDDRESLPYLRRASEELHGRKLRLGDQICVIRDNNCTFRNVRNGTFGLTLLNDPGKQTSKIAYRVAAINKEIEIVLDEWTKRPRAKNYSGNLRVVLEKVIQ